MASYDDPEYLMDLMHVPFGLQVKTASGLAVPKKAMYFDGTSLTPLKAPRRFDGTEIKELSGLVAAYSTQSLDNSVIWTSIDRVEGEVLADITIEGGIPFTNVLINDVPDIHSMRPMGSIGAGLCVCPEDELPDGMVGVTGYDDITDDVNFGNYVYSDGSAMCCVGKFYYRINNTNNPFRSVAPNDIHIVGATVFSSAAEAAEWGYALHRAFIDGGEEKSCVFVDKYMCSKNAKGTGFVASSIKNGLPISTAADHNPIADLTACSGNYYYETINALHARDGENGEINPDSRFFEISRFVVSALAYIAMAHGQACTSTANCAWYDATYNFPKGCNNNALRDVNDSGVLYESDGYSNCGKTGSGVPFAKTTHNGQECGICDISGPVWAVSTGFVRDSASTGFYVLKPEVEVRKLTAGSNGTYDAWGTAEHLATLYDLVDIPYVTDNSGWISIGSSNQVLSSVSDGNGYALAALGLPESSDGLGGTNLFGSDGIYRYLRADMCALSFGAWGGSSTAGPWAVALGSARTNSNNSVGVRGACYSVKPGDSPA